MPVEIRELVIKAIANTAGETGEGRSETSQAPVDMEAIVRECVRQVMNLLKKKEER